jgi:hypothetical protein
MKAEEDLKIQTKRTPALSGAIILLETSLCFAAISVSGRSRWRNGDTIKRHDRFGAIGNERKPRKRHL